MLGVEKETGFTLNYDKYNWAQQGGHFILEDTTQGVDFGEGKKSIYALPDAQILYQKDKEVQMAVNEFGDGRSVYISGLPYSFANSRVLYRAILWASHSEEDLNKWFSTNYNVEVHAFVKNGKYCVVNNTYEPQHTTVFTDTGSFPEEDLNKWFSTNYNVEVHAFVKNGKYCVVNNTYEPQHTTVFTDTGSFPLDLAANEIKWYEI